MLKDSLVTFSLAKINIRGTRYSINLVSLCQYFQNLLFVLGYAQVI